MLDFLVVDFFAELFFEELFFLAMALSPPFVCANLRVAKIKVNVFLRPRPFFLDAPSALALPRARRSANRVTRGTRAKSRVIQRFAGACALTSKEVHRRGAEDAEGRN